MRQDSVREDAKTAGWDFKGRLLHAREDGHTG